MSTLRARRAGLRTRRGFALIEIVMAMTILAIALAGYAKTVAMASVACSTSRETALAGEAARRTLETLRATTFAEIYARYDASAADDPAAGASPGPNFAVAGLEPRKNDADGLPGEILFPTLTNGGVAQLREDIANPKLGMPSDLNGDGIVDANDHALNYQNLPVLVRVRWRGIGGSGQIELQTVLANF